MTAPTRDEVIDDLMSKAQEFASSWSLVGGRFDDGSMIVEAEARKEELREMLRALRDQSEADAVPAGWVFYSADASLQATDPSRMLSVTLYRDRMGVEWWRSLSDEAKAATPLYQIGAGMTVNDAIRNAIAAMSAQGEK